MLLLMSYLTYSGKCSPLPFYVVSDIKREWTHPALTLLFFGFRLKAPGKAGRQLSLCKSGKPLRAFPLSHSDWAQLRRCLLLDDKRCYRRAHPSLAPMTWGLAVCCRSKMAVPTLPGREVTPSRFVGLLPSPCRLGTPRRFFRVSSSARGHGRSLLHPTRTNPWFAEPAPFIAAHFGGCTPRLFLPVLCRLHGLFIRFSWAIFR